MSLISRLLGVVLTVSGGWLAGAGQGQLTIANEAGSTIISLGANNPSVGTYNALYLMGVVESVLTPNYGTFWVFGVILAFLGLALIARGDRKPRPASESIPLLTEPLYAMPRE